MSKEEFLKIQKCVLKVNIHCDGCKHKVKKILQKIDGVFTTEIDAEQGKVTVSGNVDPNVLIKKLAKSGKHAVLWGVPKPNNNNNNNQNHLANQLKNMQIDNRGGGNHNNNKGQNPKGGNNQPKGGGQQGPNPQQQQQLQQQQQQLQLQLQQQQRLQQQLQQMKGLQDLNLPQFKFPPHNPNPNAKAVKFDVPEEEDFTDDDFDDFDDDDFDDDEFDDDEMDDLPPSNKMKLPIMMNAPKGGNNGGGGNGKKGAAPVPVQVHGNPGGNGNGGGKKGGGGGGGGGGNNQNQGGGNKNGGKNGGGAPEGKNKNNGNHGGNNHNNNNNNGGKKGNPMGGVGVQPMNSGFQNMGAPPRVMSGPNVGPMPNMAMPMPNIPAVQGLPAAPVNGGGYFQGAVPDAMPGNPFHQQQQLQQQQQQQYLAAMNMMNQQRAMGNDRFQPMMYARPPPAVNYMYPPYPYPPPDPYTHFFSDENTSSCNVM